MNMSATELNKHPGQAMQAAMRGPVIIEKTGRPSVVMVSYEHFLELEDAFWGLAAKERDKNAEWLSAKDSGDFLKQ